MLLLCALLVPAAIAMAATPTTLNDNDSVNCSQFGTIYEPINTHALIDLEARSQTTCNKTCPGTKQVSCSDKDISDQALKINAARCSWMYLFYLCTFIDDYDNEIKVGSYEIKYWEAVKVEPRCVLKGSAYVSFTMNYNKRNQWIILAATGVVAVVILLVGIGCCCGAACSRRIQQVRVVVVMPET